MNMSNPIKKGSHYYCPYDCSDSRYPKKKWKTEKGAVKHVNDCFMRPEEVEKRNKREHERELAATKSNQDALGSAKYKIGDTISYILTVVIKDTHEQRGNRLVKVRYEKECDFKARTATVKSIRALHGSLIYNESFTEGDIRESFEIAEKECTKKRAQHLEGLRQTSLMR